MSIFFIIVIILIIAGFIFTFGMMFSPKLRGKMMSKQIKATKYMLEETEDDLKDIADRGANATKDAIETTTRAIKKGLTEDK